MPPGTPNLHIMQQPHLSGMIAVEVKHVHRSLRRFLTPMLYGLSSTLLVLAICFGTYVFWEHIKDGYSYTQIVSSDIPLIASSGHPLSSQAPAAKHNGGNSSSSAVTVPITGSSGSGSSGGNSKPSPGFAGIEVPASITHDCSVNVTSQLNSWIASVPDGNTLGFSGGCYRIDQTIKITGRHSLTFDGQGATFKAVDPTGDSSTFDAQARCAGGYGGTPSKAARTRIQWNVHDSSDITFKNMIVHGANPCGGTGSYAYVSSLEAQHAFNIDGGNTNITLHDLQAYDTYGDFVYFRGTTNGHVYNCHFERNGRQGISVTDGGPILIDHNYLGNTRRATFDLEPGTSKNIVDGVTIRDNTIGPGRLLFVAAHGGGTVNNVTITGNILKGRPMTISVKWNGNDRRHGWLIAHNTSDTGHGSPGPAAPLAFAGVDGIQIYNNVQRVQAGRDNYGVTISVSTDVRVYNNSFTGADGALYVFNNGSGSSNYSACDNQLVVGGAYDQPTVCR